MFYFTCRSFKHVNILGFRLKVWVWEKGKKNLREKMCKFCDL